MSLNPMQLAVRGRKARLVTKCLSILAQAIDSVLQRVEEMQRAVFELDWPIFDKDIAEDWDKVREEFVVAESECTRASQDVIDSCFRHAKRSHVTITVPVGGAGRAMSAVGLRQLSEVSL